MARKEHAKEPLLYIHQPDLHRPKAKMQNHYIGNRKKKSAQEVSSENETKKSNHPIKTGKRVQFHSNTESNTEDNINTENHLQTNVDDEGEKKQFKNMSVIEKVEYFAGRSEFAPPVRCEVITDQKKHRGIIIDANEEKVTFKPSNRKRSIEIICEDIKDIKIIGF